MPSEHIGCGLIRAGPRRWCSTATTGRSPSSMAPASAASTTICGRSWMRSSAARSGASTGASNRCARTTWSSRSRARRAGWEKGQVENQVGTARQRIFTPRLHFADLEELNAHLLERCRAYAAAARHPDIRGKTILAVFEAEQPALIPYAGTFDGFFESTASATKSCLVRYDNNRYSVAAKAVGRPVQIQAYATRYITLQ